MSTKRPTEKDVTERSHESSSSKKGKTVLDEAFQWGHMPSWKNDKHQKVLGKDFVVIAPTTRVDEQPTLVEFLLKAEHVYNFTPNTRFRIEGVFEKKETAETALWSACVAADAEKVIVQPNWLDNHVKRVDMFRENKLVVSGDEGTYIAPFMNTMLYATMDKEQKKILCLEDCSPGNGVPWKTGDEGWNEKEGSEWRKYAPSIFLGATKKVEFGHVFFQMFPFWQHSNYFSDQMPNILLNSMLPLTIRIVFNDFLDAIFKKIGVQTPVYRFKYTKFDLVTEQLRLHPTWKASLARERRVLPYQGVTRILRTENIPKSVLVFKKTIQQVYFPEGILIFALPKDVVAGGYKYKDNNDGKVFAAHNITGLNLQYGNREYLYVHPNIGDVNDDLIEINSLLNLYTAPPFGVKMDKDKISLATVTEGWKNGCYPHIYLNLCNFMDKSRIQPNQAEDSSIMSTPKDLEILYKFGQGGATENVTYVHYLFYSDVNVIFDPVAKQFISPYIKFANQVI
jgi:hypothetical protein